MTSSEWERVTEGLGSEEDPFWQHASNPHAISHDGGETYYLITEPSLGDGSPRMYRPEERPVPVYGEPQSLEEAVFTALGAASTCWESLEGTGIFESDRAKQIGDDLVAWINEHYTSKEN